MVRHVICEAGNIIRQLIVRLAILSSRMCSSSCPRRALRAKQYLGKFNSKFNSSAVIT